MEASPQPARTQRFGVFELDPRVAELRKHGVRVRLQEQPFQILNLLLEHPGELVTREALRQKLWSSDTFVDFDRNLNKAMNKLRLALGDSAESPRFIETLHRRGYRFIAPVQSEEPEESATSKVFDNRNWSPDQPDRRRPQASSVELRAPVSASAFRRWLPVAGSAVIFLSSALFLWLRPFNVKGSTPVMPRRSVAVLGFKNLSGRSDQAWLSTALSDWLTTELSAGEQLRTIPGESVSRIRMELSAPDIDTLGKENLARIGRELGTDLVVVGSYGSLGSGSGGEIRLDLRLEDTRTGDTVAAISETGSESHLFELISNAGERLRGRLGIEAVTQQQAAEIAVALPSDHDAARAYSEGLAKLRVFDALPARDLFQKAIAIEPKYALSYSALASAWAALGYEDQARQNAKHASDLSSALPRAERLLVQGRYREVSKDWERAIEIYRALFDFYPDSLDYGLALANAQTSGGHGQDALATTEALHQLPPPLGDDSRIDLAEAAAAESLGDFKRDLAATTRAAEKARSLEASLLLAPAQIERAWALNNLGRLQEASTAAFEAEKIFAAAGDLRGVARSINFRGILLQNEGDAVAAKAKYEAALAIYRQLGNKKGVADELDNLGDVLYALADLEDARKSYEQSLAVDEEIGNQDGVALAKGALGPVLLALGDHEQAKRMSQESVAICQTIGDRSKAAIGLAGVGSALRMEGRLEEAKTYETEAISMFEQIGDFQSAARFKLVLAELSVDQGRPAEAVAIARRSVDEFERGKMPRDGSLANAVLARALLSERDNAHAQIAADKAISLRKSYHDRIVELLVELTAEQVRLATKHQEDRIQAEEDLQKLIQEATRRGFANYALQARLTLGELEMVSDAASGRRLLEALQKESAEKGFGLIAQKAAHILNSTKNTTELSQSRVN
jgi:DNA-binding winged helix-turn-helix (wHTH) protein/tetratricopeptide (TPR) repeat protein